MTKKCFKREVCAVIVNNTGEIVVGENLVYNDLIESCPREKGEGYEKCKEVCNQKGHAEIEAIKKAKERGMEIKGAKLYLMGHYKVCPDCTEACKREELEVIIVDKIDHRRK